VFGILIRTSKVFRVAVLLKYEECISEPPFEFKPEFRGAPAINVPFYAPHLYWAFFYNPGQRRLGLFRAICIALAFSAVPVGVDFQHLEVANGLREHGLIRRNRHGRGCLANTKE
jgi:hypothetical protein